MHLTKPLFQGLCAGISLSVGYDGQVYDCDFNQAAELPVLTGETIFDMVGKSCRKRKICLQIIATDARQDRAQAVGEPQNRAGKEKRMTNEEIKNLFMQGIDCSRW